MRKRPVMKNLAPAYARIEKLDSQHAVIWFKREAEFKRIRDEGARVARIALRRAGLVRGESVIRIGKWAYGIYDGTELNWPPMAPSKEWSFRVYLCTVLKSGRPGKGKETHAIFVEHPGDVTTTIRIVGKVVNGRVVTG